VLAAPTPLCALARYVPREPTSTPLYQLVAQHRATFTKIASEAGGLPRFVSDSFDRFLRCGILAHGFARFGCQACGNDHLVPLSCKTRGLCPSCGGRRMAVLTRHAMNDVLPHVHVRQWVLSLPHPLRYHLAYDHSLCTAVHRALAGALRARIRRLAREREHPDAQTGSITFVQRYGSALNLNVHLHLLALDGWFVQSESGALAFVQASAPTQGEVEALVLDVHARIMRLLERRGLLEVDGADPLADESPTLAACYEGAVTQRVGLGPARGRPVMKLGVPVVAHLATAHQRLHRGGLLCAQLDGFDLHGRVAFSPTQRRRLEQLVQYCARPPLANDRLQSLPDGKLLLELKTHWRDGTTHLKFEPIELMERLAAQIPKPYVNLVLYAGVLAPNAKLRKHVVAYARPQQAVHAPDGGSSGPQTRAEKETWAALMRATFDLDVLTCSRCGERMRYIATILDARVARKILEHLGLPARAPPEAAAKDPPPFWAHLDDAWA
jgi:hypothetical protein